MSDGPAINCPHQPTGACLNCIIRDREAALEHCGRKLTEADLQVVQERNAKEAAAAALVDLSAKAAAAEADAKALRRAFLALAHATQSCPVCFAAMGRTQAEIELASRLDAELVEAGAEPLAIGTHGPDCFIGAALAAGKETP